MASHPPPKRERVLWFSLTAGLVVLLLLFTLAPGLLAQDSNAEARRLKAMFADVFDFVRNNYVDPSKADPEELLEGALRGLFEVLGDPYSTYIPAADIGDLNDLTTGEFGGVGLYIAEGREGVEVMAPIEGYPAYRAGVSAGDVIVGINGDPATGFSVADVVSRLRGNAGTEVSMTLKRGSARFEVRLTRAMIEVPSVRSATIPFSPADAQGTGAGAGKIGYLRISQFTGLTATRVSEALRELPPYRALVVDLRNNGGGLLSSVVDVADYFLDSGTIVSTRSRVTAENRTYTATIRATLVPADVPITVLVNGGSASAAEILAGALKDTDRGYLVGQQTFGKGSVQQVRRLSGNRAIKVTTSRYYTPAGAEIDGIGVGPNSVIEDQPPLDEAGQAALELLLENGIVRSFARAHAEPTEAELQQLFADVASAGIELSQDYLRTMVRSEIRRADPDPPVYDLDHDRVLEEGVRLLREGLLPIRARANAAVSVP